MLKKSSSSPWCSFLLTACGPLTGPKLQGQPVHRHQSRTRPAKIFVARATYRRRSMQKVDKSSRLWADGQGGGKNAPSPSIKTAWSVSSRWCRDLTHILQLMRATVIAIILVAVPAPSRWDVTTAPPVAMNWPFSTRPCLCCVS